MSTNMKAQIEVIPCKVCGDKSSGVHYGVITCEGCKGFFRRSQAGPVNYQCPRSKNCVIDRVNRNRCQFCRLQKCINLGMSRDAVKFGRMSKKQREKVEDEANMVKQSQLNGLNPSYNNYPANGYTYQLSPSSQSEFPTGTEPAYNSAPLPTPVSLLKTVDLMDHVTLGKAVLEAHVRTCLFSNEQIDSLRRQPTNYENAENIRNMDHRHLWIEIAEKITMAVQQIIEFAKMVPGFMDLSQDDQIMLLKAGSFELALMQLCRVYDASSNRVIFGNSYMPLDVFVALNDEEKTLMGNIFDFVKSMQRLNLTENEMALLSAITLVSADRPGLRDHTDISKLNEKLQAALKLEVGGSHNDEGEVLASMLAQSANLRSLSSHHIRVLNRFKESCPDLDFPALHKELFSNDAVEAS